MEKELETPYGTLHLFGIDLPKAKHRVLVIPGYSESLAHTRSLVDALAAEDIAAITFSQPRKSGGLKGDPIERLADIILRAHARAAGEAGTRVVGVAHSLGAPALLRAVRENPGVFAGLILVDPTGLDTRLSLPLLLGRIIKKAASNQLATIKKSGGTETRDRYFFRVLCAQITSTIIIAKNPSLALAEARAAIKYDIRHDITAVNELGIPVSLVMCHSDELFDLRNVQASYDAITSQLTTCCSVAAHDARHDSFWMQPTRTAGIIRYLITK